MKTIFAILLFCITTLCVKAQRLDPFLMELDYDFMEFQTVKGKVKSINQVSYYGIKQNGVIQKSEEMDNSRKIFVFDNQGNLLSETISNKNNQVQHTYKKKFTNSNKLIEQMIYDNDNAPSTRMVYEYNDQGLLKKAAVFNSQGKINYSLHYEYSNPQSYYIKRFDENGKMYGSDSVTTDINNNVKSLIKCREQCTKSLYYYKSNSLKPFIVKDYNKDGLMIRAITFEFDASGNEIKILNKYNSNGVTPATTTVTTTIEYEYDEKGNWTKKIEKVELIDDIVIKDRKIEYY